MKRGRSALNLSGYHGPLQADVCLESDPFISCSRLYLHWECTALQFEGPLTLRRPPASSKQHLLLSASFPGQLPLCPPQSSHILFVANYKVAVAASVSVRALRERSHLMIRDLLNPAVTERAELSWETVCFPADFELLRVLQAHMCLNLKFMSYCDDNFQFWWSQAEDSIRGMTAGYVWLTLWIRMFGLPSMRHGNLLILQLWLSVSEHKRKAAGKWNYWVTIKTFGI